jgi:hypothetical protein
MKPKTILSTLLSIVILSLFSLNYADVVSANSTSDNSQVVLLAGKSHTKNARPSTANKHQKGQTVKENAQTNKQFKEAKKKNSKLDKKSFKKGLKQK